jgi:hypothetical protein
MNYAALLRCPRCVCVFGFAFFSLARLVLNRIPLARVNVVETSVFFFFFKQAPYRHETDVRRSYMQPPLTAK